MLQDEYHIRRHYRIYSYSYNPQVYKTKMAAWPIPGNEMQVSQMPSQKSGWKWFFFNDKYFSLFIICQSNKISAWPLLVRNLVFLRLTTRPLQALFYMERGQLMCSLLRYHLSHYNTCLDDRKVSKEEYPRSQCSIILCSHSRSSVILPDWRVGLFHYYIR